MYPQKQEPKPLNYVKEKLIGRLNERLNERVEKRQAEKEKAAERNKAARDRIVAALDNPGFLVWIVARVRASGPFDPADDTFASRVAEAWPDTDGDALDEERDPDRDLKRLIRVYTDAEDTTFEVRVTDEVYKHL